MKSDEENESVPFVIALILCGLIAAEGLFDAWVDGELIERIVYGLQMMLGVVIGYILRGKRR